MTTAPMHLILPLSLALLLATSCHPERRPDGRAAGFQWPVPAGWKHETIPFPLDFARDLSYRGLEELRFPPHFFDPASPNYWSYAFVWWLEGQPALDPATLEQDLVRYFQGLSAAVGGKKYHFDSARFHATVAPQDPLPGPGAAALWLRGQVDTYDAFTTGKELALNVEILVRDCPAAARRVLLAAASPRPFSDDIWRVLAERHASFQCQ